MLKVGREECGHVRQVVATQEHLSGQSYQPHLSSDPCQSWGARVLHWASGGVGSDINVDHTLSLQAASHESLLILQSIVI